MLRRFAASVLNNLEPETLAYIQRVRADGGEVIDVAYVDSIYKKIKELNLLNDLLYWHSPYAGVKKDTLGAYSILFDISNNDNDFVQPNAPLQPIENIEGLDFTSNVKNMTSKKSLGLSGNSELTTIVTHISRRKASTNSLLMSLGESATINGEIYVLTNEKAVRINGGNIIWGNDSSIDTKEIYSTSKNSSSNINVTKLFINKDEKMPTNSLGFGLSLNPLDKASLGKIINGSTFSYDGVLWDVAVFTKNLTASNQRTQIEDLINAKNNVF